MSAELARDAEFLCKLLHIDKGVQPHPETFEYKGLRRYITAEHIARHLGSEEVWGLVVGYRTRKANFIAADCDVKFPVRLAILRDILREMNLDKAAFATTGTTAEKGKVIVTLARRMPYVQAHAIRDEIKRRCALRPEFGGVHKTNDKLDMFPYDGEGGILRVGGLWKGQVNRFLSLDGTPIGLDELSRTIEPHRFKAVAMGVPFRTEPGKFTAALLDKDYAWPRESPPKLFKKLLAMAYEARSLYGLNACSEFRQWGRAVWARSPELQRVGSSGRVIEWDRLLWAAWNAVRKAQPSWTPKAFTNTIRGGTLRKYYEIVPPVLGDLENEVDSIRSSARRLLYTSLLEKGDDQGKRPAPLSAAEHELYAKFVEVADKYNLPRLHVGKDEEALGDIVGRRQTTVHKLLVGLERKGCIIKHTPAIKCGPKKKWAAAVYAIIGSGETRSDVLRLLGATEQIIQERNARALAPAESNNLTITAPEPIASEPTTPKLELVTA